MNGGDVRGFSEPSASPPTLGVSASSLYQALVSANYQYAFDAKTRTYEWIPGYPPSSVSEDLLRQIEAAVQTGWYMEPDGSWSKLVVPGGPVRTGNINVTGSAPKPKVTGFSWLGWAAILGVGFAWVSSRRGK